MRQRRDSVALHGPLSYRSNVKPLRWWLPLGLAVIALAFGLVPYVVLTALAAIPLGLRDHPWPLELAAVVAALATIALLVPAYRQRRVRAVATIAATLATLGTLV